MIHNIGWNPLTKVRFEAIYANIQQRFELVPVPVTCCRIGEINKNRYPVASGRVASHPLPVFESDSHFLPLLQKFRLLLQYKG